MTPKEHALRLKQIQERHDLSLQEVNDIVKGIAGLIADIANRGLITKLKEPLLGIFIDWWDKQLDYNKQFKEEWDAILTK